jgi:hypothetical protein
MNITPKYARIKLPTYNTAAKKTQTQAQILRIKNEIKFLYIKKQQLNKELYHSHILNANIWQQTWANIEQAIHEKLQQEMTRIHQKQQQKISNLEKSQTTSTTNSSSYPRVINYSNTQFTQDEILLLSKGMKYSLHYKQKNWLETLALEADTAISSLDIRQQRYYRHLVAKHLKNIKRYKEHIHAIRNNNNNNSRYSNHILNTGHTCGTINDTMDIIRKGKKGKHLNTLEKYYIHKISKSNLHMNDTYNDTNNPIFETLHDVYTR